MKHKHAEFFIAIANGDSMDDWECSLNYENTYCYAVDYIGSIAQEPDSWKLRRKQATHVVNGFTVPAPIKTYTANDVVYYFSVPTSPIFYISCRWSDSITDSLLFNRGLVHLTREAAIANAKAMCGINPESSDDE